MNNSKKLLDRIMNDQIEPKAKWKFTIKRRSTWVFYILFLLTGGLAFSVILFAIQQSEFALLKHFGHSFTEFILVLLPVLWLILLIIFLGASILSALNTERAYKLSFKKWTGLSVALSIVAGTLFFITGGAQWLETSFANQVEIYESINEKKIDIWSTPEKGNLSGEILSVSQNKIKIKDFNDNIWTVTYDSSFIAPRVNLEVGEKIKLNGIQLSKDEFSSTHIRPWGSGGYGKGRNGRDK